ncbi:MAG: EAL domain-containing protein [Eggerthellaceae bacterium]|nr:EAL domain-containing protein [Eggerthellaceae bacterium]
MGFASSCTDSAAQPQSVQFAPLPSTDKMHRYVIDHIDEAIEKGWVVPYFQPVVRTMTGKLCGLEALARWEDPTYGLLAPYHFIGALEDARLIHKLDSCIVRQVCRRYRDCVSRGQEVVPVSFNLSRLDFDLCDIVSVVEDAVREYEVPRNMINIEITETIFGADPSFMVTVVNKFHVAGYQVWMDDFGSGYSTLNVLKDFDFDELKIDMEFLNRFGDKSKTILASVVDMSKKLGIQTLAEGVETQEQSDYLRSIGCEKMQGYLYGKPMPYEDYAISDLRQTAGVESMSERLYFSEVGAVNTLSLSERDLTAGNTTHDYVTSMPFAIMEYAGNTFSFLDWNPVFRDCFVSMGIPSIEEVERRINDTTRSLARHARYLVNTLETEKFARIDYVTSEAACVIRVRHITSRNGRIAMIVSIDDTIERYERKRRDKLDDSITALYSIYELISIIDLDSGEVEPLFGTTGLDTRYEGLPFEVITNQFIDAELFPADRARYREFIDGSTMMQRIRESGESYIVGFFRVRQIGGDYAWKLFALISLVDQPGNRVMLCVRSTHWSNDGLFQMAFDGHSGERDEGDGSAPNMQELPEAMGLDLRLTDGSLWRAVSRSNDCAYFWKDRERRFVGANQKFLEYYGFDSVDAILGKTDEDMGWHINPAPFREDELRVLNEGANVEGKMGQCIVRGEVHDIVATKHPVYRNGRIVGLVGFFIDVDMVQGDGLVVGDLPLRDPVTNALNYTGLEAATWRFVDSYVKLGLDFAMISVNVENYSHINEVFGYEFGDKVLARVADELRDSVGSHCAIGHVYAERFVVLAQGVGDDKLTQMCDDIERRLSAIARIDGTPCTVYALASFARYSEHRDIEAMKRKNRDSRRSRQGDWNDASESDVITSTLL